MPSIETDVKSSWADEIEEDVVTLPPPSETVSNGIKTVIEYKLNEDGKKVKVLRQYKIERRAVSKSVAQRKLLPKFGISKDDKPGPHSATTIVGEDVYLSFLSNEEQDKQEKHGIDKLKGMNQSVVKCRNCEGDHWTTKCPFPEMLGKQASRGAAEAGKAVVAAAGPSTEDKKGGPATKYVPPSLREGGNKRGESMTSGRRDETAAIRLSNLSENAEEHDLEDLVKPFGAVAKIYLARDKITNVCKGFAYVHFKYKADAERAISVLNGYGYDHLILNVEWSKPSTN